MTSKNTNLTDMTNPSISRLSRFLFSHYCSNPGGMVHSPISDQLAVNLANPETIMELADLLAKIIDPSLKGKVTGLLTLHGESSPPEQLPPCPSDTENTLGGAPLVGMMGIEPMALWSRAYLWLREQGYHDALYKPSYRPSNNGQERPAIHGSGLGVVEVNKAIAQVLIDQAPEYLNQVDDWFAVTYDDDGWIYSRAFYDPDA